MSRDIRFRAWFKSKKQMIYSPMAICGGDDDGWVLITAWIDGMDCNKAVYGRPEFEIMQFTGLLDKDKKPIYEGDIMGDPNQSRTIFQIVWDEQHMAWAGQNSWAYRFLLCENPIGINDVVIGNIYENSDLLENAHDA